MSVSNNDVQSQMSGEENEAEQSEQNEEQGESEIEEMGEEQSEEELSDDGENGEDEIEEENEDNMQKQMSENASSIEKSDLEGNNQLSSSDASEYSEEGPNATKQWNSCLLRDGLGMFLNQHELRQKLQQHQLKAGLSMDTEPEALGLLLDSTEFYLRELVAKVVGRARTRAQDPLLKEFRQN